MGIEIEALDSASTENKFSAARSAEEALQKAQGEAQKKKLMAAYDDYQATGDEESFFSAIVDFAERRLARQKRGFTQFDAANEARDYAQDVALAAFKALGTFTDATHFFHWLLRVIVNKRKNFFWELMDAKYRKLEYEVQLPVKKRDVRERSAWERVENPEMFKFMTEITPFSITFPVSFDYIDRNICKALLELKLVERKDGTLDDKHLSYREVGEMLNMTEDAVKQRIHRMRKKVEAEPRAQRLAAFDRKREADLAAARKRSDEAIARIRASKQAPAAAM